MKKSSFNLVVLFFSWPTLLLSSVQLSSGGVRAGQVMPSVTNQSAMSVGLQCDLVTTGSDLIFQPFFDYWGVSYEKNLEKRNRQLFAIGLSALKPFNLNNSKAVPFVGGGLGMTFNSWRFKSPHDPETPSATDHEFDLALHVVGGITVPVTSTWSGLIQLKYSLAGLADYFGFWIGVSYHVNQNTIHLD